MKKRELVFTLTLLSLCFLASCLFGQTTPTLKQVTGAGNVAWKPMFYNSNYHNGVTQYWATDKKYVDSMITVSGGYYVPLAGTGTVSPLTGTIVWNHASQNKTALGSTTKDFFIGAGDNIDISSATKYGYAQFYRGGEVTIASQDITGNFLFADLNGSTFTLGAAAPSFAYQTGFDLTKSDLQIISNYASFPGITYSSATASLVSANQYSLSVLPRWVSDDRYAPLTLTNGYMFLGNASNIATGVLPTISGSAGTFSLSNTGVFTFPDATTSLRGLLTSTDWNTFNGKESALTFSTGLTRTTNTVTNDLSTGVSGGQTLIGSTSTNSGITIKSTSNVSPVTGADIILQSNNTGLNSRLLSKGNWVIGNTNLPNSTTGGAVPNLYNLNIYNDAALNTNTEIDGIGTLYIGSYNSSASGGQGADILLSRNRGTSASMTQPLSGDAISTIYSGSQYSTGEFNSSGTINYYATENWSSSVHGGGAFEFQTTANNAGGGASGKRRLYIDQSGYVGIGTGLESTSPSFPLDVNHGSVATTQLSTAQFRLAAGATSADFFRASLSINLVAGTGTNLFGLASGNVGAYNTSQATTAGNNCGVLGLADNGNVNLCVFGNGLFGSGTTNVGVCGVAGGVTNNVGGYFGLNTTMPTFTNAAIIIDNAAISAPILIARDNGTAVFTISDGGGITATSTLNIASGIVGTSTTTAAAVGIIGQGVTTSLAVGSAVTFTTATAMNVITVTLTAGDWDVSGHVNFSETLASVSARSAGITTTSATIPTDGSEGENGVQSTIVSEKNSITINPQIIRLSATTNVYLVASATFSAGTAVGYGSITYRRVR